MDSKLACTHEHSLTNYYVFRFENDNEYESCEVCGNEISGESYNCRRCQVWLHEACANQLQHLPYEIIHPLHSQHQLKLLLHRHWDFICDKCLYISAGSRYNCSSCNFNLDLTCASSVNDLLHEKDRRSSKDRGKRTIQHYSHDEKLTILKYRKIKKDDYNCSWCEKRLLDSDVCYGCLRCEFFLHKVCSNNIPRALNHPFHPSHPLRLHYIPRSNYCDACGNDILFRTSNSPAYGCQMCNFRLDFLCAKLSPTLKHKCHDHLLTYFGKSSTPHQQKLFECTVCNMLCDANFYRCVQCNFNLHLRCVPISSSAKHKYHRHPLVLMDSVKEDDSEEYYCDVCENNRNPNHPVYCCEKCTFIVHIECILHEYNISSVEVSTLAAPSTESKALIVKEMEHNERIDDIRTSQQLLFQPLIHEHPMKFYEVAENVKENRYCNGCLLVLSGPSYVCTICPVPYDIYPYNKEYHLHERCAKLPYEIQHPFHSTHPLNLYASYRPFMIGNYIVCDECRDIAFGFIYLCEECNFKLDVKCALTGVSQLKEMERVTELHHFNHPHQLILGNSRDPNEIECTICELSILGPAYCCPSNCIYIIHESCLGLPQKMQVPFHLEHMLVFGFRSRYDEESRCYACRLGFDSFGGNMGYSCEKCQVKLHTICAKSLRRPLKYESHSHMHNLYYFGPYCQLLFAKYRNSLFRCSKCQGKCRGRPFYRCLECAINFHLECVPIPQIVKSKCHIHPLVLKDSFVEDDSGECCCDVCEEERCQNDQVYCCEECNNLFVADIECALAKVENILSYLDPHDRRKSPIIQGKEEEESTASKELEEEESTASEELEEEESTASKELEEEESTASEEEEQLPWRS